MEYTPVTAERGRAGIQDAGRPLEAHDPFPPIRRQDAALFRTGTGDPRDLAEDVDPAAAPDGEGRDGAASRVHQVPPKVEYGLTGWGQALCPALDALLQWAAARDVTE